MRSRRWWADPSVGPMLAVAMGALLLCNGGLALIRGARPFGSWLVWGGLGIALAVLAWLQKRAEQRYAAALAPPPARTGDHILDPARRGPHTVYLRSGKLHIQLHAISICRNDGDLWMLYGPPGMVVPPEGEILIVSDHQPVTLLLQTEEVIRDGELVRVFTEPPTASHTPN